MACAKWFVDSGFFLDNQDDVVRHLPPAHKALVLGLDKSPDPDAVLRTLVYFDIETIPFQMLDSVKNATCSTLSPHCKLRGHFEEAMDLLRRKDIAQCVHRGFLDCAKYLFLQHGGPDDDMAMVKFWGCNTHVFAYTARRNNVLLINFLKRQKCPMDSKAFLEACKHGHVDMVRALHRMKCPVHPDAMMEAALRGHLEVIQILFEISTWKWDYRVAVAAARNGYLRVLDYLATSHKYPLDEDVLHMAALRGHVHVVEFLMIKNVVCDVEAFHMAAWSGSMDMVECLYRHHCPWNEYTMYGAACQDDDFIVQYLHERGCPWNAYVFSTAASKKSHRVLAYLEKHGCPIF